MRKAFTRLCGWLFPPKKRQLSQRTLDKRRLEKLLRNAGLSKSQALQISHSYFNP